MNVLEVFVHILLLLVPISPHCLHLLLHLFHQVVGAGLSSIGGVCVGKTTVVPGAIPSIIILSVIFCQPSTYTSKSGEACVLGHYAGVCAAGVRVVLGVSSIVGPPVSTLVYTFVSFVDEGDPRVVVEPRHTATAIATIAAVVTSVTFGCLAA